MILGEFLAESSFDFKFPYGWQFILLVACLAILACILKWRRFMIGGLSLFSLLLMFATLIAIPISGDRIFMFQVVGVQNQSDGGANVWHLGFTSVRGGYNLELRERNIPPKKVINEDILSTHASFSSASAPYQPYPLLGGNISFTHYWPYLEKFLGFQLVLARFPPDSFYPKNIGSYSITVPQWFILLFCPWFPLIWFRRHRRHRFRVKNGFCLKCGFDLRAHKSGDKCPECGTPVPTPAIPPAATTAPSAQLPPT